MTLDLSGFCHLVGGGDFTLQITPRELKKSAGCSVG